jgi:nucleoside-diphosphate-sugar epimerase
VKILIAGASGALGTRLTSVAPKPMTVPAWFLRPMPYAHAIMTATCRVSAAKARQELGWAPSMRTLP